MHIVDPIYKKVNDHSVLLMSGNTLIASENQIRHLIDAETELVTIDTDKGIDTFQSLLGQKTWDELTQLSRDKGATESLLSKHFNTFITSFTNIITTNITSRMLIGENRVTLVLKEIVLKIQRNVDILMAMIRLKGINEYTYSHSINVTVMCVSLANQFGFNFTDITRFGTGALLSDLGMTSFPSNLTRRPSGLSKKEKEEIQKHPKYTLEFIKKMVSVIL